MKHSFYLILIILSSSFRGNAQDLIWAKGVGGPAYEAGYGVALDGKGNVVSVGIFDLSIEFDSCINTTTLGSSGFNDIFIQKLDRQGCLIWAKRVGGALSFDAATSVAVDDSGYVYTTGSFDREADFDPNSGVKALQPRGYSDAFILKLDSAGNYIWAQRMGGSSYDQSNSLAIDALGNVLMTGEFSDTAFFDSGSKSLISQGGKDIFVQKVAPDGHLIWAKSFGGNGNDIPYNIKTDIADNIYVTGLFRDTVVFDPAGGGPPLISKGATNVFILKLDSDGNFLWSKSLGGTGRATGFFLDVDQWENVILSGGFSDTVDFDPGPGIKELISETKEKSDIFLIKLDANGDLVWANSAGGVGVDVGYSVEVDPLGYIYNSGFFNQIVDFDPGPLTANLTATGYQDIFIQKLDPSGNLVWAKRIGGTGYDVLTEMEIDDAGRHIYATGFFENNVDFDPTQGTHIITSKGFNDAFILNLKVGDNVGLSPYKAQQLRLSPNPTTGFTRITLPTGARQAQVQVVDHLGKTVTQGYISPSQNMLELSRFSSGIYHVTISLDKGEKYYGRILLRK